MDKKLILIGLLLIVALVVVSGCTQPGDQKPSNDIKSEKDVEKRVDNITTDIQDAGSALNELINTFI